MKANSRHHLATKEEKQTPRLHLLLLTPGGVLESQHQNSNLNNLIWEKEEKKKEAPAFALLPDATWWLVKMHFRPCDLFTF